MRRSKSDPAKYARNYRKISQRRMTQFDHLDEDKEIERLRVVLTNSEAHLKRGTEDDDGENDKNGVTQNNSRKRKSSRNNEEIDESSNQAHISQILSSELQKESEGLGLENPLIVLPSKKKKKTKKESRVQLTPEEIKQAKSLQKKTSRKLLQLETRKAQKTKREELYKKLEENKLSSIAVPLLSSSATLSRKQHLTKKQILQKLLKKERAGITLTEEEKGVLYSTRTIHESEDFPLLESVSNNDESNTVESSSQDEQKKSKKSKKSSSKQKKDEQEDDTRQNKASEKATSSIEKAQAQNVDVSADKGSLTTSAETVEPPKQTEKPTALGMDFAAQMMASMTKLKKVTDEKIPEPQKLKDDIVTIAASHDGAKYIPEEPAQLKTAATLGIQSATVSDKRRVLEITRPEEVQQKRYNLPVSAMEFEIVDAIRNNDVTILCGETGSGKSTQVPQFLYEAGFGLCPTDASKSFKIGITQPRRVAAVSTAKRVCYEMGHGDGQAIRSRGKNGNLVSYKTRYESAGQGSKNSVSFMTDGVLLQEIQSDLLLRQYSVIVLDEIHERNLNTDVLIGLLSAAIDLRRRAAAEDDTFVPLKIILMSATLRVEDFTNNDKLFPNKSPAIVRVPGRTFPVTVHHSKATELDEYETVAYRKVCKMHRKLPPGGILVFLTGKNEIVWMVNRLRKAFRSKDKSDRTRDVSYAGANDVAVQHSTGSDENAIPRDMDDEEFDAEEEHDDFDNIDEDEELPNDVEVADDNIPKKALILPMHSMLSVEEQSKVFAKVPEGYRLIVVATNICETSITIPDISYVVDTGRQKCRNYNSSTGVASYDIMWISRAAADQRAGRAGRTGPGHCYRLYSSSLYARHMDAFEIPEVLTRPLEDVVLAMKSLQISDVSTFPFPTPPDTSQLKDAVRLLARIGCVDISNVYRDGGDGAVTKLGSEIAKLPLGVRCGKMLLVAANAGVLDYAIAMVAVLTETSIFQVPGTQKIYDDDEENDDASSSDKDDDEEAQNQQKKRKTRRWHHPGGDVLAATLAVGACAYAGRGSGGVTEQAATRKFCEDNGLNFVAMCRVQKMRNHLARLAKSRLGYAEGTAAKTGSVLSKMKPPSKVHEVLLAQAIASGLLDHVAIRAPPGSISGEHPFSLRTAYISCTSSSQEPLFLDRNSVLYARDSRVLPKWICYNDLVRKTMKDGNTVSVMKNVTPIEASWVAPLASGSSLLSLGKILPSPSPIYDAKQDAVMCFVQSKFGSHGWELPPVRKEMYPLLQSSVLGNSNSGKSDFMLDDSFRWFARYLLEGKVFPELEGFHDMLNDNPAMITRKSPHAKVSLLVSALSGAGVDSAAALRKHWAEQDDKFLFHNLKSWIAKDKKEEAKRSWIAAVKSNVRLWNE